jgi:hypothetical protein
VISKKKKPDKNKSKTAGGMAQEVEYKFKGLGSKLSTTKHTQTHTPLSKI